METQGTTSLTGAVIDSTVDPQAAASKNTLTTGDLVLKDIENKADYKVSSKGIAYNKFEKGAPNTYNEKGLIPVLMPGASDKDSSVTKAAIGVGTITVKNQPNFDVAKLNRDTQNSLNKLDEIFDKKKIEERQELAKLIAKDAFNQLHYWNPKTKEDKAAKAIAHGIVGEITARVAGNAPGSGFTATMTNEALAESIAKVAKDNPDVAQWLSAIVGATVNKALDKDASVGAAIAQYGTKWNEYQFDPNIRKVLALLKEGKRYEWQKTDESGKSIKALVDYDYHDLRENEWLVIKTELNSHKGVAINNQGDVYDIIATGDKALPERFIYSHGYLYPQLQFSTRTVKNYDDPIDEHVYDMTRKPTSYTVEAFDGRLERGDLYNAWNTLNHVESVLKSALTLSSDRSRYNNRLVHSMGEEKFKDLEKRALNEARYAYQSGKIDPNTLNMSYYISKTSVAPNAFSPISGDSAWIVDKNGNVYLSLGLSAGKSVGLFKGTGLIKSAAKAGNVGRALESVSVAEGGGFISGNPEQSIPGVAVSATAVAGKGGSVGITTGKDISGEILMGNDIGVSISIADTWYIGNVKK